MLSAKSHKALRKGEKKETQPRRKHLNKKFYNSKAWKETRSAYMRHYRDRLFREIPEAQWAGMGLMSYQVTYILAFCSEYLPCEICLKLYAAEAYEGLEKGEELDHIVPVNPENAFEMKDFGDPYSFDNLQLLCKRHHAKKSQRER